ncbi:MAG: PAS domain-containing protein [Gammaproteobacteria bacterium]|nr:PAS domain-containing protein [Gammaproteobacteria bacterium]
MPTIQPLLSARSITSPDSEISSYSREQLKMELVALHQRLSLSDPTEHTAQIGHYEWNTDVDRLESCSEEHARLFNMTVEEVREAQNSWDKMVAMVHPDDRPRYAAAIQLMEDTGVLNVQYRSMLKDDLADIVSEDRERVAKEYLQYIDSGEGQSFEYRIRRPDGAIRWLRELSRARQVEDGRVTQTLGVIQDITDRVAHEQELVFKDVMASQAEVITNIGYFLYDLNEDRHLYMSPGLARIAGLGVEELRRKVISDDDYVDLICELDRERVRKLYNGSQDDLEEWEIEYRLRRPDGELRWVREVSKTHPHNDDGIKQIIGVIQDISENKKAEQEITRVRDTLEQHVVERTRELANTVKQLQVEIEEREKVTAELHLRITCLPPPSPVPKFRRWRRLNIPRWCGRPSSATCCGRISHLPRCGPVRPSSSPAGSMLSIASRCDIGRIRTRIPRGRDNTGAPGSW